MSHADLRFAWLRSANLEGANLSDADLQEAEFKYARLDGANFNGAKVSLLSLFNAASLKGVTMPDGVKEEKNEFGIT